jgi:hypothetical protein
VVPRTWWPRRSAPVYAREMAPAVQRRGEGRTRLDAYSPVNWGGRFSNIAVMPSVRSFDGRNAEFHAAT